MGLPGPARHLGPLSSGGCNESTCCPPVRPINDQQLPANPQYDSFLFIISFISNYYRWIGLPSRVFNGPDEQVVLLISVVGHEIDARHHR